MSVPRELRITLLGKTEAGKSSLGNTILGNDAFPVCHFTRSEPSICEVRSGLVHGRTLTVVDTPGFFCPESSEQELKQEILRCSTRCPPGPHAFLLVFKLEKFTEQEEEVITKIEEYFSAEVFKFCVIVFTHGDQLPEETRIETFISQNTRLSNLLEKCGGRCHVVDNRYWNQNQQDEYRNNQKQVEGLLQTIEELVRQAGGGCYTIEMLHTEQRKPNPPGIRFFDYIIKYTRRHPIRTLLGVMVVIAMIFKYRQRFFTDPTES